MTTTELLIDSLTPRDREVMRALVADKIDQLLPMTRMGRPWRDAFQAAVNNGSRLVASEDERLWAMAHAFVLREQA